MGMLVRWIVSALIGAIMGAAIWAGITYFTNYEIGWIAWGIGLLVGIAVRMGAENEAGFGPGAVAAIFAVASILAGKYAAIHLLVNSKLSEAPGVTFTENDELVKLADEVATEWQDAKKKLRWPPGQSVETAQAEPDYPKDVWAEAKKRWDAIPAEEQQKRIHASEVQFAEIKGMIVDGVVDQGFKSSFSPADLLFFGLAVFTAFKVGSGLNTDS